MATRTYLTEAETPEAIALLRSQGAEALSRWLDAKLEARLSAHALWQEVRPYRLGSWARGELCAKSDIDLLFIGPEEKVKDFVRDLQNEGVKIRYRVPADIKDWTKNVEAFDVLALLGAQPFFAAETAALREQQALIAERGASYRRELFAAMKKERKARAQRYDSIANYLEPNLKYGPGGLRDLEQGLMIRTLFPERFVATEKVIETLAKHKNYLLGIRHFLHLHGGGDSLTSALQKDAAVFFGEANPQKFMSRLEATVAEVSFYADWIAESAAASKPRERALLRAPLKTLEDALKAFKKDPSVMMQQRVRESGIALGRGKGTGKILEKYFNIGMSDEFVQALFRSGLIAKLIPSLERLRGHVQHDQYHRYSVDAHTLQAVREVLRIKRELKRLGPLAKVARQLTLKEWNVLVWSALYHDLGKGLKGDHSSEGAELTKRDLVEMGVSLVLTGHVTWMVQSHLILSAAAFRQNPQSPSTWAELFRRGVHGRRLLKLAVFTAADIRATNPDAWTDWKARLLSELVAALTSPKASHLSDLLSYAEKKKLKIDREFVENLDPQVVESLPRDTLLNDYKRLRAPGQDLSPDVWRNRRKETWVRFHSRKDRPGIFVSFVKRLHLAGLSVQEAYIQTYQVYGAYDWFKVKTTKTPPVLTTLLRQARDSGAAEASTSEVKFAVIEVVSQDDKAAVLSFRGKDQRGALLAAAQALFESGFEIQSAKVHTWGRQIEDVFTVKKAEGFEQALAQLRQRLQETT